MAILRRIPATSSYVVALVATTAALHILGPTGAHRVLAASSTNLHQLAHRPVRSLVASAFWVSSGRVLPWAVMLGATAGVLEWNLGALRTVCVFAAGHVGASLLVAGGLTVGVVGGFVSPSVENVIDVGPSYGFAAMAAALVVLVPRRARPWYLAALAAWLALGWSDGLDFTAVGHLAAASIGFALVPVVARWSGLAARACESATP